jgi:TATA-box binding protein (TBP) (component of TFIID and TFIIIB)
MVQAEEFMEKLHQVSDKLPVKLSTMTVLVTTTCTSFLDSLLNVFKSSEIQSFVRDVTGDESNITMSPKQNAFLNSILFTCNNICTDHGTQLVKQSIKVFCNGNMHITGVKCIKDALYIADVFSTMIELVCGGNGVSEMFNITGFDIQLINYCYTLPSIPVGHIICLNTLYSFFTKNTSYYAAYNTERHSGIIVKAPHFCVLIFASGNIILSSIKTPEQLDEAYSFSDSFMKEYAISCIIKDTFQKNERNSKKLNCKSGSFDYGKYLVLS